MANKKNNFYKESNPTLKVKYSSENKNRRKKDYFDNKIFKFEIDYLKKFLFDSKINFKKETNKK